MQKIIFFLIFSFHVQSINVWGQEIQKKEIESLIQSFADLSILENLKPKYSSCTDNQILNIENTFQQCLESICGKSDDFENHNEYLQNFISQSAENFGNVHKDLKNRLLQLGKAQYDYKKLLLQKTKKLIENNDLEITQSLKPLHNFIFLFGVTPLLSFNEDITIKGLNNDVLKYHPYNFSENEKKWILDSFKEIDLWKDFNLIMSSPSDYLQKKYPDLSLKEAVLKDAEKVKKLIDQFKKNNQEIVNLLPVFINSISESSMLEKVLKNEDLLKDELEDYLLKNSSIERILPILSNPSNYPILNSKKDIDLKKISEILNIPKKINEQLSELSIPQNLNNRIEEVTEKCYATYLMKNVLPTRSEIANFKKMIQNYKSDFKKNALPDYSDDSKRKISNLIDKLEFILPSEKESSIKNLERKINEVIKESKYEIDFYTKAITQNKKQISLLEIYGFMNLDYDINILNSIESSCDDEGVTSHLSDATNTISGKVKISWQSIKLPIGKGIIFHEIGHNLYHAFKHHQLSKKSFKKFNDVTSCLNTLHPEISRDSFSQKTIALDDKSTGSYVEGLYTDEDFADMVSAKASTGNSMNFACHFLLKNKFEYQQYSLKRYNYTTLINEYESDPHSSDLFRILHLEFLKNGDIPLACKNYLTQTGSEFPIKNCL